MWHKFRRAARIWSKQGSVTLGRKAINYAPIEINNLWYRLRQEDQTRVMDEDWDILLLLDACRYDVFVERNTIEGSLDHRYSLGSTSEEFLHRNFTDDTFHDTVYVNANPYVPYLGLHNDTFHAVIDLLNEWDDKLETVRPKTVADAALAASNRFPNKRLIIHFMQPHTPFIGELGRQVETGGWDPNLDHSNIDSLTIWQRLRKYNPEDERRPKITQVQEAYRENLDLVIEHAANLVSTLDGTTVISTDHGNMIGERLWPVPTRRMYGHPYGVYHPNLVKVPWLRVEGEYRRKVVAESPLTNEGVSDGVAERRLEALGYK